MTGTATGSNLRENILDAALELMAEHGAVGMSMRQLASRLGVQVAAIYHYFPSKDALLDAVVAERQYGTRLGEPLDVDPDAPPAERLRQLFADVWAGSLDEEEIWRVVLIEGLRGEPSVLPVGQGLIALLYPAAQGWIEQYLPEIPDARLAGRLLVGQLLAGFVHRIFEPDLDPNLIRDPLVDTLVAILFPEPEAQLAVGRTIADG